MGLLEKEAEEMKDTNMKELMRRNIFDTLHHEKAVANFKSYSEITDKMESENKARKIYREPSIYERNWDAGCQEK